MQWPEIAHGVIPTFIYSLCITGHWKVFFFKEKCCLKVSSAYNVEKIGGYLEYSILLFIFYNLNVTKQFEKYQIKDYRNLFLCP